MLNLRLYYENNAQVKRVFPHALNCDLSRYSEVYTMKYFEKVHIYNGVKMPV
jgi:hypothetical protein